MTPSATAPAARGTPHGIARLSVERAGDGGVVLQLEGSWRLRTTPSAQPVEAALAENHTSDVRFDTSGVESWDTGLALFVTRVERIALGRGVAVDRTGLPPGLQRLLRLAGVERRRTPRSRNAKPEGMNDIDNVLDDALEIVGLTTLAAQTLVYSAVEFLGGTVLATLRWMVGRARYRRVDLVLNLQEAGLEALPVVGLVSFLLGLILAFVGAIQLELFDATIYTADLVGIAMVRDMAALMTAVVMAGRSGASYAAQLGTMQVNQEVDALTTLGISPLEYLVMPRVVALLIMMPLLTVYADIIGILGGAVVGVGILDLSGIGYYNQTVGAVSLDQFLGGLFKAATYGALIGLAGCFEGIRAERSSAGVGRAATAAVVNGIVLVISACGLYAVLFYYLGL
jgi:phospholipid/cholesterol/gamma-HCH transport system permease protein